MHERAADRRPVELRERGSRVPGSQEHPRAVGGGQPVLRLRRSGRRQRDRLARPALGDRASPSSPASIEGHHGGTVADRIMPLISDMLARAALDVAERQAGLRVEVQREPAQLPVEREHHRQAPFEL